MKPKELQEFMSLYGTFDDDCERVKAKLKNLHNPLENDIMHAYRFWIEDGCVNYYGTTSAWNETEEYYGDFDPEMLTMTDDELEEYVRVENEKYDEKQKESKKLAEKSQKEQRRKLYEELRKEFDK